MRATVSLVLTVLALALLPSAAAFARPALDPPQRNSTDVALTAPDTSGGTDWVLVGALVAGGILLVGGVSYAVRMTHRPHGPVGTH